MKPPRQISIRERTDHELAQRAVYLGSHEHKNQKWWGGLPEAGNRAEWQTTTICPLTTETDRIRATGWVKIAIKSRQCRFSQEDKNFPKWIWHEADGQFWMGYLVNDGLGQYKGWPIDEDEKMKFLAEWVHGARNASEVERATMCRLRIMVGEVNACSYWDDRSGSSSEFVTVPAVHLAEGIATDWWTIFGGRDVKRQIWPYRTGFILPCLSLTCDGSTFEVSGEQMHCDNPGLRFWQAGSEMVPRSEAEAELAGFVESVVGQLSSAGIRGTDVQLRWERVAASRQDPEEKAFCEAAGALGADPYCINDADEDLVMRSGDVFADDSLDDFLAGVRPLDQCRRKLALDAVTSAVQRSDKLFQLPDLSDAVNEVDVGLRNWRFGEGAWGPAYRMARAFRRAVAVGPDEELGSVTSIAGSLGNKNFTSSRDLYGVDAVVSRKDHVYVHLRPSSYPNSWSERFNFARAIGDIVCFPDGGTSVVNGLHGAERQAMSRSFAAEFLAPLDSVLEVAQEVHDFDEIAGKFSVSPRVIEHQIQNQSRIQQACANMPRRHFE